MAWALGNLQRNRWPHAANMEFCRGKCAPWFCWCGNYVEHTNKVVIVSSGREIGSGFCAPWQPLCNCSWPIHRSILRRNFHSPIFKTSRGTIGISENFVRKMPYSPVRLGDQFSVILSSSGNSCFLSNSIRRMAESRCSADLVQKTSGERHEWLVHQQNQLASRVHPVNSTAP